MSGLFGPKLVILLVILAMLGTGFYIAYLTQQTTEAKTAVESSPGRYADLVSGAINETDSTMSNGVRRR